MLPDSCWMRLRRRNSAIMELVSWGSSSTFRVCIFSSCSPPTFTDNPPTWNLLLAQAFAMFSNSFLLKTWGDSVGVSGTRGGYEPLSWQPRRERDSVRSNDDPPCLSDHEISLGSRADKCCLEGGSSAAHVSFHVFRPVFQET